MLLEYKENSFIDIDEVKMTRVNNDKFFVGTDAGWMKVSKEEYDTITEAFVWKHNTHLYGPDMKLIKRGMKKNGK